MAKYSLPSGMRYTTLRERMQFYKSEFDLSKIARWFENGIGKTKFAVIMGRHTGICRAKYRDDIDTTVIIDKYQNLNELFDQLIEFLPESVYYDRNVYDEHDQKLRQELAFDLDPENINCPVHGGLSEKMKRQQGLSFCHIELEIAKAQVFNLFEYLEEEFSNMQIVYSGRGFHIHVFDCEAYELDAESRRALAMKVKTKGFGIDEWVTSGEMRLIRLPYSLHGLVSRIVVPLAKSELEKFDPVSDPRCLPQFLN